MAIWGSIASWFIFLLIYCIPDIALYIAPHMIGQVWNCFLSFGNQCNDLMCGKKGYVSKVLCRWGMGVGVGYHKIIWYNWGWGVGVGVLQANLV